MAAVDPPMQEATAAGPPTLEASAPSGVEGFSIGGPRSSPVCAGSPTRQQPQESHLLKTLCPLCSLWLAFTPLRAHLALLPGRRLSVRCELSRDAQANVASRAWPGDAFLAKAALDCEVQITSKSTRTIAPSPDSRRPTPAQRRNRQTCRKRPTAPDL